MPSGRPVTSPTDRHQPNGPPHQPDWSRHQPGGSRYQSDGSRHQSDGSRYQTDGSRHQSDGSRYQPDGSRYQTDGSRYQTDGSHNQPDWSRHQSDWSRHQSDGSHHQPDGSRHQSDGSRNHTDESRNQPDWSRHQSDGSRHQSDESYNSPSHGMSHSHQEVPQEKQVLSADAVWIADPPIYHKAQHHSGPPTTVRNMLFPSAVSRMGLAEPQEDEYGTETESVQQPRDYILPSILGAICCPPFGLVALFFACRTKKEYSSGHFNSAQEASKNARDLMLASIGCGVILIGYLIIRPIILGQ